MHFSRVVRASLLTMALTVALSVAIAPSPATAFQPVDTQVPPGNPVIGSDRPGDIEPEATTTNYALWSALAFCLLGAGVLLVKIERWEAQRVSGATATAPPAKLG